MREAASQEAANWNDIPSRERCGRGGSPRSLWGVRVEVGQVEIGNVAADGPAFASRVVQARGNKSG